MNGFEYFRSLERVRQPLYDNACMRGGGSMNIVKVGKDELLAKLKENRDKHHKIWREALEGYREAVIAALDQRLQEVREGKKVSHVIRLQQPEDHTTEYDEAITMLEGSSSCTRTRPTAAPP